MDAFLKGCRSLPNVTWERGSVEILSPSKDKTNEQTSHCDKVCVVGTGGSMCGTWNDTHNVEQVGVCVEHGMARIVIKASCRMEILRRRNLLYASVQYCTRVGMSYIPR